MSFVMMFCENNKKEMLKFSRIKLIITLFCIFIAYLTFRIYEVYQESNEIIELSASAKFTTISIFERYFLIILLLVILFLAGFELKERIKNK